MGSLPYGCWKHAAKALVAIACGCISVHDGCLHYRLCAGNLTQNCHIVSEYHVGTNAAAVYASKRGFVGNGLQSHIPTLTHSFTFTAHQVARFRLL